MGGCGCAAAAAAAGPCVSAGATWGCGGMSMVGGVGWQWWGQVVGCCYCGFGGKDYLSEELGS